MSIRSSWLAWRDFILGWWIMFSFGIDQAGSFVDDELGEGDSGVMPEFALFRVTSILVLLQMNHWKSVVYSEVCGEAGPFGNQKKKIQACLEKRVGRRFWASRASCSGLLPALSRVSRPLPAPWASMFLLLQHSGPSGKESLFLISFQHNWNRQ